MTLYSTNPNPDLYSSNNKINKLREMSILVCIYTRVSNLNGICDLCANNKFVYSVSKMTNI